MTIPSDLEISRSTPLKPLPDIAAQLGIGSHLLEPHGRNVAKISLEAIDELAGNPQAKYVVVSAITPTPLGEGKTTTTTIGLGQALHHLDNLDAKLASFTQLMKDCPNVDSPWTQYFTQIGRKLYKGAIAD